MIFFFFFPPDLSILGKFAAGRKKEEQKEKHSCALRMLLCGLKFLFSPQSCLFLLEHQNFVVYHARDRSWCLRMALNVEFGVAIVQKRNINIVGASGFSTYPTQTYATCASQVVRAGLPLVPSLRSDRAETPGRVIFHTCRHCSGCRMEGGSGDFYTI